MSDTSVRSVSERLQILADLINEQSGIDPKIMVKRGADFWPHPSLIYSADSPEAREGIIKLVSVLKEAGLIKDKEWNDDTFRSMEKGNEYYSDALAISSYNSSNTIQLELLRTTAESTHSIVTALDKIINPLAAQKLEKIINTRVAQTLEAISYLINDQSDAPDRSAIGRLVPHPSRPSILYPAK